MTPHVKIALAALAAILVLLAVPAAAEVSYVGSSTLGEQIIPEAARAFTARTGIRFGSIEVQSSGKGAEKRSSVHYRIIGYDALGVYVHQSNPVTSLTKAQLKAIYTGAVVDWRDVGGARGPITLITQPFGVGRAMLTEFHSSSSRRPAPTPTSGASSPSC
jgi:phosphate transport system substrate-binding protein